MGTITMKCLGSCWERPTIPDMVSACLASKPPFFTDAKPFTKKPCAISNTLSGASNNLSLSFPTKEFQVLRDSK